MTSRLTPEEDSEHAMALLRQAYRSSPWNLATQRPIDDICCFGLPKNTPCGRRMDTITILKYEYDERLHIIGTCSYHAIVLKNAIDLWRSEA